MDTSGLNGCSVLVVEDHAASAEVLAKLLKLCGLEPRTAMSAKAALALAAERRFNLVVCDIGLPDGDGCDLFRAVNQLYPVRGIALSGHGSPEDVERSRAAGFVAHLTKPVMFDTLRSVVERVCGAVGEAA